MFPAQRKSGMKRRNPGSDCAHGPLQERVSAEGPRNWPDLLTAVRCAAIALMAAVAMRPWVRGYKRHPILAAEWAYLDVQP